MRAQVRPAIMLLLGLTLLTGFLYPLVVTGLAQALFPHQADGSLIVRDGQPVGSELIGQPFEAPRYFWGRPSATAPFPYNAAASAGSNLGPTNEALREAVTARIGALKAADPVDSKAVPAPKAIPVDLVTASASGLDPHISPAAADYQVRRVAWARQLDEATVRRLVAEHTRGRQLGVLGEPRVNVLELNLALDAVH